VSGGSLSSKHGSGGGTQTRPSGLPQPCISRIRSFCLLSDVFSCCHVWIVTLNNVFTWVMHVAKYVRNARHSDDWLITIHRCASRNAQPCLISHDDFWYTNNNANCKWLLSTFSKMSKVTHAVRRTNDKMLKASE
jgi:hypothetical protein